MKKNKNEEIGTSEAVPAKKKSKKKWIIIVCVILGIFLLAMIFGSGDDSESGSNGDVQDIKSTQQSTEPVEKKITAGHSISTKDLKISYLSCNTDFKKYNPYTKPASGNKVIRAEFEFENISSVDQFISGTECYADDSKCELFFGTDDSSFDAIDTVAPGRKVKAAVYYEVPVNAKTIEIEIDGDFWSNEKIIFEVK